VKLLKTSEKAFRPDKMFIHQRMGNCMGGLQ
jgi:hypothetical protein